MLDDKSTEYFSFRGCYLTSVESVGKRDISYLYKDKSQCNLHPAYQCRHTGKIILLLNILFFLFPCISNCFLVILPFFPNL